jgi:hypothetical protein
LGSHGQSWLLVVMKTFTNNNDVKFVSIQITEKNDWFSSWNTRFSKCEANFVNPGCLELDTKRRKLP